MSPRSSLLSAVLRLLTPRARRTPASKPPRSASARGGRYATVEVPLPGRGGVRLHYAPRRDGAPDAGEIIWAWVPFQENDGRGKDRPLLVIARQGTERMLALKLTSKSHDSERDYLSIGSGAWDGQRRESWVDIDQLYSVHPKGIRREAAALDARTFDRVATVLRRRYGWT